MISRPEVEYETRRSAGSAAHQTDEMHLVDDLMMYLRRYAREKPQAVAYACFGIGFILGWKLKPW
jgi:hypothetical protein